jgi:hypothetical protein
MTRPKTRCAQWTGTVFALLALAMAGCSQTRSAAPSIAAASPSKFCARIGGSWNPEWLTCATSTTNAKHYSVKVTARYPTDLIEDPTSGPVLREFVRQFFERFTRPDDSLAQDGSANLTFQVYEHGPATKSIVFTENWNVGGMHPNDAIDTFSFDLAQKKQLALADLFCSGIDPPLPQALNPFVQQYVQPQVDSDWLQPGGQGVTYSSGYKAWAMDGDDLVILMPADRTGPVHAGAFKARVPLSGMRAILRGGGCAA